jgi:hypothetical protein
MSEPEGRRRLRRHRPFSPATALFTTGQLAMDAVRLPRSPAPNSTATSMSPASIAAGDCSRTTSIRQAVTARAPAARPPWRRNAGWRARAARPCPSRRVMPAGGARDANVIDWDKAADIPRRRRGRQLHPRRRHAWGSASRPIRAPGRRPRARSSACLLFRRHARGLILTEQGEQRSTTTARDMMPEAGGHHAPRRCCGPASERARRRRLQA